MLFRVWCPPWFILIWIQRHFNSRQLYVLNLSGYLEKYIKNRERDGRGVKGGYTFCGLSNIENSPLIPRSLSHSLSMHSPQWVDDLHSEVARPSKVLMSLVIGPMQWPLCSPPCILGISFSFNSIVIRLWLALLPPFLTFPAFFYLKFFSTCQNVFSRKTNAAEVEKMNKKSRGFEKNSK